MSQPDTKFSAATHLLILLTLGDAPPSSTLMAQSVGVNASQVRRLLGLLKRDGIVTSRQGAEGYELAKLPEDVTLLDVYEAVYEHRGVSAMAIHRNPSDKCQVGRHIAPVLGEMFGALDARLAEELASITLAQAAAAMREAILQESPAATQTNAPHA